jgi:hypothetical protein
LCSIAATTLSRCEHLPRPQVLEALAADRQSRQHVEVALELGGEVVLEQPPRPLRRAFDGVACVLVHAPLLDHDLLARADEPRALLADAVERGVELLGGLDARRRRSWPRSR